MNLLIDNILCPTKIYLPAVNTMPTLLQNYLLVLALQPAALMVPLSLL